MRSLNIAAPLLAIIYAGGLVAVARGTHPAVIFLGALALAHMFYIILMALHLAQTFLIAIAVTVDVELDVLRAANDTKPKE